MNTSPLCPGCGKPVGPDAPKGLCQECLLKAALPTGTDTGGARAFEPPTIAELAPKFPQLEIFELVGSGGMGAVYRARQKELDRIVALKILPPGISQDAAFAERFTREARALARLNHPGIVTLYEFGRANGLFYFLMEFVDGASLRRVLEAGRMSSREALAVVPQICDALQYAHDQGIVHRDIKPENILLDRQGRVKVADFGLAKLVGSSSPLMAVAGNAPAPSDLTGAGKIMGTPRYMAPEQAEHPGEVDHRADIYALGVVLYQMLTGELPGRPIEPPSKLVSVDVRLDEVVLRALEQSPERRYQQASVLKSEVQTIVASARDGGSAGGWSVVPLLEPFLGMRFGSQGARKALDASVVGLIVLLGAMALIGLNRTPWVGWCIAAGGLLALAAPIAVALALETRARKNRAGSSSGNHGQEKGTGAERPGNPSVAVPPWVRAFRWTARLLGSVAIVALLPFILAEGLPPIVTQPEGVQLTFAGGFLLLVGFIFGFWRDGMAALFLAAGWTALRISEQGFPSAFDLVLVPMALYALCWWAGRAYRVPRLLVSASSFGVLLTLGRLLLPVNVFVSGIVSDAVGGRAITNAEVMLLPRPALPSWETNQPSARTDNSGRFHLYVGWYSAGKEIVISAPEHRALTASLGPRALGARKVNRDFQLAPEANLPLQGVSNEGAAHPLRAGGTPALLLDQRGLTVTALSNELWEACVTFRNSGRTASPVFPVLFYAGDPKTGGRLFSRNTAGPVPPGGILGESTGACLLRSSETEVFAVIDPENTLGRDPASAEWILRAPTKALLSVRQQIDKAFEDLKSVRTMDNDRAYTLDVQGIKRTGGSDDFLRRRSGQEILVSGLSCGCGDYASAFIGLMENHGLETLWVEGVEVSLASLKHRFSGHVVVAVRDPANGQWLLVDPTARAIVSENWSRTDQTFESTYWIGFVGSYDNYPVHSPEALRDFYDRTLKKIPAKVLNQSLSRFQFAVDASLQAPDGSYLNPHLEQFLANYGNLLLEYGVHPEEEVSIRLIKGANDAISKLTYTVEKGWVCTVGLKSACSLGFLSYLEREVSRKREPKLSSKGS